MFDAKEAWGNDDGDEEWQVLPPDLSHDFPIEVFKFIEPTGLRIEELIKHGYFYSKITGGLVRVCVEADDKAVHRRVRGKCRAYETRRLRQPQSGPKAQFRGSKEETIVVHNLLQQTDSGSKDGQGGEEEGSLPRLVIVEDSLSSIKVGRHVPAEPLFGSSISLSKLIKLVKPFKEIFIWLDSDKLNEARKIGEQVGLIGKKPHVIYTELDPKYVSDEEIKQLVGIS